MPMGSWIPYVAKPSTNTASEFAATIQSVEYDLMPGMEKTAGHFVNEVPEDPFPRVPGGVPTCLLSETPGPDRLPKSRQRAVKTLFSVRGLFTDMYVPLVTFGEGISGTFT